MRKHAVVGILLLAALVTPPDVITQLILFTVVYGLYEVSIFLVARVEKKDAKLREEGYFDDEDEFDDDLDDDDEDLDKPKSDALDRIAEALEPDVASTPEHSLLLKVRMPLSGRLPLMLFYLFRMCPGLRWVYSLALIALGTHSLSKIRFNLPKGSAPTMRFLWVRGGWESPLWSRRSMALW